MAATIRLTKREIRSLLLAIELATDSEYALIDAHLSPYDRKPIPGSHDVIRDSENRIGRWKRIESKLKEAQA